MSRQVSYALSALIVVAELARCVAHQIPRLVILGIEPHRLLRGIQRLLELLLRVLGLRVGQIRVALSNLLVGVGVGALGLLARRRGIVALARRAARRSRREVVGGSGLLPPPIEASAGTATSISTRNHIQRSRIRSLTVNLNVGRSRPLCSVARRAPLEGWRPGRPGKGCPPPALPLTLRPPLTPEVEMPQATRADA